MPAYRPANKFRVHVVAMIGARLLENCRATPFLERFKGSRDSILVSSIVPVTQFKFPGAKSV